MKIEVNPFGALQGIALENALFGSVVRRANLPAYYLVIATMDGTGRRALVTLQGGIPKELEQDTRVIPVEATLYVYGDAS